MPRPESQSSCSNTDDLPKNMVLSLLCLLASRCLTSLSCRALSRNLSKMDIRSAGEQSLPPPFYATVSLSTPITGCRPSSSDALKGCGEGFSKTTACGHTVAGWNPSRHCHFPPIQLFQAEILFFPVIRSFDIFTLKEASLVVCDHFPGFCL